MKVFCTGWQRTGTSSLASALNLIGVRTLQYPWRLLENIDHHILDEFDGFADNPIPLVYRELDARFPGSKFIHTERDDESWLKSVEWLMTVGSKKFRWDRLPKAWEMSERLYGTREFDPDIFLARYQRHNAEVRGYFAARPNTLLILDVTVGGGFEPICDFLGKPLPAEPFPHKNQQESLWRNRWRQITHSVSRKLSP